MFSRIFSPHPHTYFRVKVTDELPVLRSLNSDLARLDLALVLNVGYVDPKGKNGQISGIHTKKFVSGHHA